MSGFKGEDNFAERKFYKVPHLFYLNLKGVNGV